MCDCGKLTGWHALLGALAEKQAAFTVLLDRTPILTAVCSVDD